MILLPSNIYFKIVEGSNRLICVVMTSMKQLLILMCVCKVILVIVSTAKLYGRYSSNGLLSCVQAETGSSYMDTYIVVAVSMFRTWK